MKHQKRGERTELDESKQPKNFTREALFRSNLVKDGLRNVASHHVESFNFAFGSCLPRINQYMMPIEVVAPTDSDQGEFPFKKMTIWFEDLQLKLPERTDARG